MFSDDAPSGDAALLQSMTLLATLQAAADVWEAVAQRRAGRDPSAQEEPSVTRPALWQAYHALTALRNQLRLALVRASSEQASQAAVTGRFDDLLKASRLARVLQGVHQRLMSLYPAVPETLVEEARRLHVCAEALTDAAASDAFTGTVQHLVADLGPFLEAFREALQSGSE